MIKDLDNLELTESMYSTSIFIFILIIGLIHEWNQGTLEWAN